MNLLLSYFFELRFRLLTIWWKLFDGCGNSKYCDVLMFHHISDKKLDINSSCQCSVSEFRFILESRITDGFSFISLDQLAENIEKGIKGYFCTITFDDVPDNFITSALPILEELSLPFCLFVSTKLMHESGFLSKEQVIHLSTHKLCTIGSHTCTHSQLRKSKNSLIELSESKRILEDMINKEVKYLAYPFGRQSSVSYKDIRYAKEVGYRLAFSTIPTSINTISIHSRYFLPRVIH